MYVYLPAFLLAIEVYLPAFLPAAVTRFSPQQTLPPGLTLNISFQPLVLPESRVSGRARPALLMQMSTPLC